MVEQHGNGQVTLLGADGGKIKLSRRYWNRFLKTFTRHIRLGTSRLGRNSSREIYFGSASLQRMSKRIGRQSASSHIQPKQQRIL